MRSVWLRRAAIWVVLAGAVSCPTVALAQQNESFYEPNLCGPIALYAICQAHGVETTIDELSELCGYDGFGVTIAGIVHAAEKKGLAAKAYRSSVSHLKRLQGPAIIDLPRGHFCVLVGWRREGAVVFDPPEKSRIVSRRRFGKQWGGHVITFQGTRLASSTQPH